MVRALPAILLAHQNQVRVGGRRPELGGAHVRHRDRGGILQPLDQIDALLEGAHREDRMEELAVLGEDVAAEAVVVDAVPGVFLQMLLQRREIEVHPRLLTDVPFVRHASVGPHVVGARGHALPQLREVTPFGNVVHDVERELVEEQRALLLRDLLLQRRGIGRFRRRAAVLEQLRGLPDQREVRVLPRSEAHRPPAVLRWTERIRRQRELELARLHLRESIRRIDEGKPHPRALPFALHRHPRLRLLRLRRIQLRDIDGDAPVHRPHRDLVVEMRARPLGLRLQVHRPHRRPTVVAAVHELRLLHGELDHNGIDRLLPRRHHDLEMREPREVDRRRVGRRPSTPAERHLQRRFDRPSRLQPRKDRLPVDRDLQRPRQQLRAAVLRQRHQLPDGAELEALVPSHDGIAFPLHILPGRGRVL